MNIIFICMILKLFFFVVTFFLPIIPNDGLLSLNGDKQSEAVPWTDSDSLCVILMSMFCVSISTYLLSAETISV